MPIVRKIYVREGPATTTGWGLPADSLICSLDDRQTSVKKKIAPASARVTGAIVWLDRLSLFDVDGASFTNFDAAFAAKTLVRID
jgi:hypothetical protein